MSTRNQLTLGILLSLLFLWLALRGVNFSDLWTATATFNWLWAIPFVALTLLSMWVRAWRWHYFLRPTVSLSTRRLFGPMMAGFAINGLLPARIGEFARAYVLARRDSLPFTRVLATIVVERIFDTFTLLALLAFVFATLEFDPAISYPYSTQGQAQSWALALAAAAAGAVLLALGLRFMGRGGERGAESAEARPRHRLILSRSFLGSGAALVLLCPVLYFALPPTIHYGQDYNISGDMLKDLSGKITVLSVILLAGSLLLLWQGFRNFIQALTEKTPFAPHGIRLKISGLISTFSEGLHSLRDVRIIGIVTVQSLVVWLLCAWSMQIMAYGFEGMRAMTMTEAIAILVITCLAILIPAAPGYWGLMELGIKFGMVILAIDTNPSRVMAYALITHALQYFPITGIGLYYLWKEHVSLSEIRKEGESA